MFRFDEEYIIQKLNNQPTRCVTCRRAKKEQ